MTLHVTLPSLLALEDLDRLRGEISFWGEKSNGWHYDLMLMSMNLVILATAGGRWVVSL